MQFLYLCVQFAPFLTTWFSFDAESYRKFSTIEISYQIISRITACYCTVHTPTILKASTFFHLKTFLQSTTVKTEEWRVKRRDIEEWMRHRQLPQDLQERVRRFVQYKWIATRGVDEESILRDLPLDLRRQIQRHLCLALVRRVSVIFLYYFLFTILGSK